MSLFSSKRKQRNVIADPSTPEEIPKYDHEQQQHRQDSPEQDSQQQQQQDQRPKLTFHCQQAQGSPTGIISGFTNVKELYGKIASCYDMDPAQVRDKNR